MIAKSKSIKYPLTDIMTSPSENMEGQTLEFNLPSSKSNNTLLCIPSIDTKNSSKINYSCVSSIISPGVQKSGTSFTYIYLTKHPEIETSVKKEINFYMNSHFSNGLESYTSSFPSNSNKITIDFSPKYMMLPESIPLIYQTNPAAKFVVMLRDPVDRAYSHYRYQQKLYKSGKSYEQIKKSDCKNRVAEISFKQYISEEYTILSKCNMDKFSPPAPPWIKTDTMPSNCSTWDCFDASNKKSCSKCFPVKNVQLISDLRIGYLSHGLYYSHILHYLKYFPMENFFFVRYEDLKERGETVVLNEIAEWIGVKPMNESGWGPISEVNTNEYPPIEHEDEKYLSKFFERPNKKLYELIGRDMGWK